MMGNGKSKAVKSRYLHAMAGLLLVTCLNAMLACDDPPSPQGPSIADFENGKTAIPGGSDWHTFSDKQPGGTSWARVLNVPDGANHTQRALRIEGKLTSQFIYPYAGAQAFFREGGIPEDVRKYTGIQFWVRGDGHSYSAAVITAAVTDYDYFSAPFRTNSDWTLVEIPFSQLKQTIPWGKRVQWTGTDARGIAFDGQAFNGDFWFQVDEVRFY